MSTKPVSQDPSQRKKRSRQSITIEMKHDIIKRAERGDKTTQISKDTNLPWSTIKSILNDKDRLLDQVNHLIPMHSKKIRKNPGLILEMEKLLILWLEGQLKRDTPLSIAIIRSKALAIFKELQEMNGDYSETFNASKGWYARFKTRANLQTILPNRETRKVGHKHQEFSEEVTNYIKSENFQLKNIFIIVKFGLYWNLMPSKKNIQKDIEMCESFSILFGCNALGNIKIKPLIVSKAEKPKNVDKRNKIIWEFNESCCLTSDIIESWFSTQFTFLADKTTDQNEINEDTSNENKHGADEPINHVISKNQTKKNLPNKNEPCQNVSNKNESKKDLPNKNKTSQSVPNKNETNKNVLNETETSDNVPNKNESHQDIPTTNKTSQGASKTKVNKDLSNETNKPNDNISNYKDALNTGKETNSTTENKNTSFESNSSGPQLENSSKEAILILTNVDHDFAKYGDLHVMSVPKNIDFLPISNAIKCFKINYLQRILGEALEAIDNAEYETLDTFVESLDESEVALTIEDAWDETTELDLKLSCQAINDALTLEIKIEEVDDDSEDDLSPGKNDEESHYIDDDPEQVQVVKEINITGPSSECEEGVHFLSGIQSKSNSAINLECFDKKSDKGPVSFIEEKLSFISKLCKNLCVNLYSKNLEEWLCAHFKAPTFDDSTNKMTYGNKAEDDLLKTLKEAFQFIETAMVLFEKKDPVPERSSIVNKKIYEAYKEYRELYKEKINSSSKQSDDKKK